VQVVDLLEAGRGELLDEGRHVDACVDEADVAQPAANAAERGQVDLDDRVDAGPLDLDDDILETGLIREGRRELGSIRLAERRGGDRRLVEARERAGERRSELRLRKRPDGRERDDGDFVLQPFELFGDLGRQHVEARRHVLADFDHEPAEVEREPVELAGDALHAAAASALAQAAEADAGQEDLPPPGRGEVAGGEPQDAAVAGASVTRARCVAVAWGWNCGHSGQLCARIA
jgi:hypothetical protein